RFACSAGAPRSPDPIRRAARAGCRRRASVPWRRTSEPALQASCRYSRCRGGLAPLQRLTKADLPFDLLEAEREVRFEAHGVVERRVARDFLEPARPCPLLGRLHEPRADAEPAHVGVDVPALEEGDGRRDAALGVVAQTDLDEPGEASVPAVG